jgi:hypothetical protein
VSEKPRSEGAVQSLRQVFERIWPVDRKPVFNGLVRAIDEFDREQKRRRRERRGPSDRTG